MKINLSDSIMTSIIKLAEGNPGALTALTNLYTEGEKIDAGNGILAILDLDDCEIYGSNIWILYKDICDYNISNVLGILEARRFGLITGTALLTLLESQVGPYDKRQKLDIQTLLENLEKEKTTEGIND